MTITINTDDPNAIAGHIWSAVLAEFDPYKNAAARTYYEGIQNQCATVTVDRLEFSVGYDPNEDGILWAINYLDSDGTREMLHNGGWAPGDEDTAQQELAQIVTVMNSNTTGEHPTGIGIRAGDHVYWKGPTGERGTVTKVDYTAAVAYVEWPHGSRWETFDVLWVQAHSTES